MTWTAITDGELTAGQLVLATTWKKLIDNVEAVNAGDPSVTTLSKRILIDAQTCTPGTPDNYILFGDATYAEFYHNLLSINQVMPFYSWQAVGVVNWIVPSSGWYEITVQGGGGGGASTNTGSNGYPFGSPGGSIRVHKRLTAGETLMVTVGAGGAVASNGSPSSVVGSSFNVGCSGGPGLATNTGSFPLSATTYATNTIIVCDQPLQLSQMGTDELPVVSSAVVGWGGSSMRAGHSGIVIIERISNNGL